MARLILHSNAQVSSPYLAGLLGPSGALSYAAGFVPRIRQLQANHRAFHLEPSGFHSMTVLSSNQGFRPSAGFHPYAARPCENCGGVRLAPIAMIGAL